MSDPTTLSEPSMQILTPRRRGRPKAEQPCTALTAWVPVILHDKIIALAAQNEASVSKTVTAILVRDLLTMTRRLP